MVYVIECALLPCLFISWSQEADFVSRFWVVEHQIAALIAGDPTCAVYLCEIFIAACNFKTEKIESEWQFGSLWQH